MASEGLDGMLLFSGQSQYYLTGYDSFGFVLFQCLYLGADGRMTLLTRAADVPAAEYTSVLEDIRIWIDGTGQGPAEQLRDILDEHGCRGKRLGVEYETWGLTGRNAKRLDAALDGFCTTVDVSELVARIRLVKSEAELVYVRRAAALADEALSEANRMAVAGAFEGEILAAMQGAVFKGGGDYPGNEFTIGSGRGALLARYHSGRRHLDAVDQLTVQIGGVAITTPRSCPRSSSARRTPSTAPCTRPCASPSRQRTKSSSPARRFATSSRPTARFASEPDFPRIA